MVQMSVSQKHSVDTIRWNGEWLPVSVSKLPFLIKPAIHEDSGAVGFQKVPGTCDVLNRTEKL
jgi:hypothetical protein